MSLRWLSVLCSMILASMLAAADLEPIPAEETQQIGRKLLEQAAKLDSPQWKLDADLAKANGIHVPKKLGALLIPPKDLKEDDALAAKLQRPEGATLGFLFMYELVPVVDGKPVKPEELANVSISDSDDDTHKVNVVLLTAREVNPGEYRLYVHGRDAKPLLEAKFSEQGRAGITPIAVELKEPNTSTRQGKLVLTVFEKYQATFDAAFVGNE